MMTTDRCRDWMLTLPEEYYSRDIVEDKLRSYDYIGQLESGKESGYRHFQIYVENKMQSSLRHCAPSFLGVIMNRGVSLSRSV